MATASLSSSVPVIVTVLDVNDNSPEFEPSPIVRWLLENRAPGSFVVPPITATDADEGDNAKVSAIVGES